MLPPGAPTPLPEEKIGRLALACPAPVQTQSFNGGPVSIGFELPVVAGGQAPITVGCTPEPGHAFGIGTTQVSCRASDALQQAASCTFQLTVLGPPKLSATRFLAFGDSITAGWVSHPDGRDGLEPTSSYPYLVERDLRSRYVTQTIDMVNAGAPGEDARDAGRRFASVLRMNRPDVVLLMHGTNDLSIQNGGGPEVAADAVDSMVRRARALGVDVVLMTVAPQRAREEAARVPLLNARIRQIAARRDVVLIDVHQLVLDGSCQGGRTIPCMGPDGLHPTRDGYRLIADEVARVIVDLHDVEILPGDGERSMDKSLSGPDIETPEPFLRGRR